MLDLLFHLLLGWRNTTAIRLPGNPETRLSAAEPRYIGILGQSVASDKF